MGSEMCIRDSTKPDADGGATGGAAGAGGATGATGGAAGGAKGGATGGAAGGAKGGTKNKPPPVNLPPLPIGRDDGLLHLSPAALQQMLAAAVAASAGTPSSSDNNKLPKFWEEEPEAWFSVFHGHFDGRPAPVSEHVMFNRMLPLLPMTAVSLCHPLVSGMPVVVLFLIFL